MLGDELLLRTFITNIIEYIIDGSRETKPVTVG